MADGDEELHVAYGLLRRAQHLAQMGSDIRDMRSGARKWSDECYRIFGVSPDTFVPTPESVLELIHPDDRAMILAVRAQIAAGICPDPISYKIVRPDGNIRYVHREWEFVQNGSEPPVQLLGTLQDVTQQRRTEERLRQAQKTEAIATLTGGMAHDFNNLLGIIICNLDLAREETRDQDLRELISEALNASLRGADLVQRLLAAAGRQPLHPSQIDLNRLVGDLAPALREMLGTEIAVNINLGEPVCPVTADPTQLEASLINLVTNAREALADGGPLTITTASRHLEPERSEASAGVAADEFAMLEVADTGAGLPPEIASRIFDPFFTTKQHGYGTGLGLSMVSGFVRQSGGHVVAHSEIGKGTAFRLYFPRTAAMPLARQRSATEAVAAPHERKTILVIEDNDALRRAVVRQVRELGYHAIESSSAVEAFEVLQREDIDLLFTDIVMPGKFDGMELASRARQLWPELKIVLTSGFPREHLGDKGEIAGSFQLLSKPYRRDELAAVLETAFITDL